MKHTIIALIFNWIIISIIILTSTGNFKSSLILLFAINNGFIFLLYLIFKPIKRLHNPVTLGKK